MAYLINFNNAGTTLSFITHEADERIALMRGFHLLISELSDDYDRGVKAQDEVIELNLDELKAYTFLTDVRAYRSELKLIKCKEISYEDFNTLRNHAEDMGTYCN